MVAALHIINGFDPARMGQTLLVACVACTPLTAKLWQRWKAAAQGDSVFAGNRLLRGAAAVWEVIHPVLLLLLAAMALAGDSYNPFLYFRF